MADSLNDSARPAPSAPSRHFAAEPQKDKRAKAFGRAASLCADGNYCHGRHGGATEQHGAHGLQSTWRQYNNHSCCRSRSHLADQSRRKLDASCARERSCQAQALRKNFAQHCQAAGGICHHRGVYRAGHSSCSQLCLGSTLCVHPQVMSAIKFLCMADAP